MLKTLINNSYPNSFILIEDSIEVSSKFLLKEFIEASKSHSDKTFVLCYEKNKNLLKRDLDLENSSAIFIDCFYDYHDSSSWDPKPISSILEPLVNSNEKISVIIDSLTPLFYNAGSQFTYKFIHRLISKPIKTGVQLNQFVLVSHLDTLPEDKTITALNHLATLSVHLIPSNSLNKYKVFIKQLKKNGKVIEQEEFCWYDKNHVLVSEEKKIVEQVEETIDPNELTTFKLSLEDAEIKARSEVVLPYIKTSENSQSGGRIFYTPDVNDDWDEEDPDDDLDI